MARHDDGRCFVQFAKTPMTMVNAQTTSREWLIQFPVGNMGFYGHGKPPTRFLWLHLRAALAGEPPPKPLKFELKPDGGWRLENPKTGETLEGFLSP